MKHFYSLTIILLLLISTLSAQDTLRMMQYNLMYYTDNSGVSDCNASTNNLNNKDASLKTIFQYVKPDVFCVNEIGSNVTYADRILNNDINVDGIDYYQHGPLTNYSGGYISNMIFYDARKLSLYQNYYITTSYRDINGYKMYYKSQDLSNGDTVFITFWIAHLKAGSSEVNAASRLSQTQRLMSKISSMGAPGNYVLSGDFNIYSSNEDCYQKLVNYSNTLFCFYDPIDRAGNWNNNSAFADIHTQSTHSYSDGCFSTGGLDDRFDFILVSPYVYYGSERVQVLPESYHALGQDGRRFNGSIVSPNNTVVPTNVANALYNMSDHLPIISDFIIDATVDIANVELDFQWKVVNPVRDNLEIMIQCDEPENYTFEIFSMDGRRIALYKYGVEFGIQKISIPFDFKTGMYILKVTNSMNQQSICKLVK